MSALFVPRDADLMEAVGLPESARTFFAADAVFSLNRRLFFKSKKRRPVVAFCFANLFEGRENGYQEFVSSCAKIVESPATRGCGAVLLSFTAGADERMNADIAEKVNACVEVLDYERTLAEVRALGQYRAVVGMRFHACVLSLLARVPVIPISYSSKTERLMRDCGMECHMSYYCNSESAYYAEGIPCLLYTSPSPRD